MIPQADTRWFLSQVIWTAFFLFIQYLLSRFLIFRQPMQHKLSKKLSIELILQEIESLKDDISTLKNQRMELQMLEHRERSLIKDEVIAEQKIIYAASLQQIKEQFAIARKKSESSLREYESQPIDLEVTHEEIARKLAKKIGEVHAR